MLRVALVGYGYWGPNVARNLAETDGVELAWIIDLSEQKLLLASRRYPRARVTQHPLHALVDPNVDAFVITTPAATHLELALKALEKDKHVLVTKPLATTVGGAERLATVATERGLTLLVDHTFLYTGAVRRMRELITADEVGRLLYVDSVRVNLGLVQADVDVLWDLAVHDISILLHLTDQFPVEVSAIGADPVGVGRASLAHLTCWFADGLVSHTHANWLSPVKVRKTLIAGTRMMIAYDDIEPTEKLRLYDSGVLVDSETAMVDYRVGDVWAPKLEIREALATECEHFLACIESGTASDVSGPEQGVDVVRVLDAARRSLDADGVRIAL